MGVLIRADGDKGFWREDRQNPESHRLWSCSPSSQSSKIQATTPPPTGLSTHLAQAQLGHQVSRSPLRPPSNTSSVGPTPVSSSVPLSVILSKVHAWSGPTASWAWPSLEASAAGLSDGQALSPAPHCQSLLYAFTRQLASLKVPGRGDSL